MADRMSDRTIAMEGGFQHGLATDLNRAGITAQLHDKSIHRIKTANCPSTDFAFL